jgi:regulator of CtrA degradation
MEKADGPIRLLHLDALYNEALGLAEAAHAYIMASPPVGAREPLRQLIDSCETTRLVSRVGFCLAWLLARRAVQSGEMPASEALDGSWRLGGRDICLEELPVTAVLAPSLARLLERSASLYRRIDRLDRQLDGSPTVVSARVQPRQKSLPGS